MKSTSIAPASRRVGEMQGHQKEGGRPGLHLLAGRTCLLVATTHRSIFSLASPGAPAPWAAAPFSALSSTTYHAGMRWPHHSCREMHQSLILSIQLKKVASNIFGMI